MPILWSAVFFLELVGKSIVNKGTIDPDSKAWTSRRTVCLLEQARSAGQDCIKVLAETVYIQAGLLQVRPHVSDYSGFDSLTLVMRNDLKVLIGTS